MYKRKNQEQNQDFLHFLAENSDQIYFKKAENKIPAHWRTVNGEILWLEKVKDKKNNEKSMIRFTTLSECYNNRKISQGMLTLHKNMQFYQEKINKRITIAVKKTQWTTSLKPQYSLRYSDLNSQLEVFLHHYFSVKMDTKKWRMKLKRYFQANYLALDKDSLCIIKSKFLLTTRSIQVFRKKFNVMMQDRITLFNKTLRLRNKRTIGYLPLGLESDCTPERVLRKIETLSELEKHYFISFISEDLDHFCSRVALIPQHVDKLIQPLLHTVMIWNTLWAKKSDLIHKFVMQEIQTIRIHPLLIGQNTNMDDMIDKIEQVLLKVYR